MILDIDKRQEVLRENIQGFFFLSVNKLEMFKYLEYEEFIPCYSGERFRNF